jgi:hypothetical protein
MRGHGRKRYVHVADTRHPWVLRLERGLTAAPIKSGDVVTGIGPRSAGDAASPSCA